MLLLLRIIASCCYLGFTITQSLIENANDTLLAPIVFAKRVGRKQNSSKLDPDDHEKMERSDHEKLSICFANNL
jgi:hypothetical protein